MYNEELKNKYLTSIGEKSFDNSIIFVLNSIEPFEIKYGKDIYLFNDYEITDVLDEISGVSNSSKQKLIRSLQRYVKWCKTNNIPNVSDSIFKVSVLGLNKIKKQMAPNPIAVQKYLNAAFAPEDDKTVELIYRAYYWLAYMGIKEDDLMNIKTEDVNLLTRTIKVGYSEHHIYDESFKVFIYLKKLDSFIYKNPIYSNDIVRDRECGNELLRSIKGNKSIKTLRFTIMKTRKYNFERRGYIPDEEYSYSRLFKSGYFYRIYELEKAGYPLSFTELTDAIIDKSKASYNPKKLRMDTLRKVKKDYELWKLAFNI